MALSQALSTGISGLMSHQKAMDNIGNNLANVNTVGFKKGVYQFSTLLEQSLRGGMAADGTTGRGSINPIAMGLGVQTGSINKVFTQGNIETTNNINDMAIDGNGFFVVKQGNSGYAYTRAGSFYIGADGSLMAGNGLYVQGTMARMSGNGSMQVPTDARMENIVIAKGSLGGMSQTSEVGFIGNLDSRKEISTGLRLFGSSSYPTVNNLQQWMWNTDFNGGDISEKPSTDETWNSLQQSTYGITQQTLKAFGAENINLPEGINKYAEADFPSYSNTAVAYAYHVLNKSTGEITDLPEPLIIDAAWDPNLIPLIQEVKVVNGGNVQTSAAYGIQTPDHIGPGADPFVPFEYSYEGKSYIVNNNKTFPPWFYESTGGNFVKAASIPQTEYEAGGNVAKAARIAWPDGINGDGWPTGTMTLFDLPRKGETYAASLNTPLEHLWYQKSNKWVQPFANIKNGDDITLSFRKGQAQVEATFTYNRPVGPDPANGQQSVNREKSYTLEHFLKFMAGDVDEPSLACANITPAMFGAPVSDEYPDGNVNATDWDKDGYEYALRNIALAVSDTNMDTVGGAMGLLSIPPQISDLNYGSDSYDSPIESAGAYSRTGVQKVYYDRWDPTKQEMVKSSGSSFNVSLVSNLGSQNALSDIRISYNNVPHETMFAAENEYSAQQGGAAMVTIDFYDSLGNPKEAVIRFAMVSKDDDFTTWRWYADCVDDTDFDWQADPATGELISNLNVGTGLIRFDKNGDFVKGAEFSETQGITINQSNQGVNEPIWISIINGLSSSETQNLDFSGLKGAAEDNDIRIDHHNGSAPGVLESFSVSRDGTIVGVYDNGHRVEIGRIGLATFPNENGLIAAGNDLFYASPASGNARYGHANLGGAGEIVHMALESSNVDLAEEFTKLISTERGFQANSRTITTADEMITELLNLKR